MNIQSILEISAGDLIETRNALQQLEEDLFSNSELVQLIVTLDPAVLQSLDRSMQKIDFISQLLVKLSEGADGGDLNAANDFIEASSFKSVADKFCSQG